MVSPVCVAHIMCLSCSCLVCFVQSCIETYEGALRKFHALPSIWLAYASCLYAHPAHVGAARDLLKRALSRTDKSEHIGLMVKFASLEFNVANNVDRARTIMEGVRTHTVAAEPARVSMHSPQSSPRAVLIMVLRCVLCVCLCVLQVMNSYPKRVDLWNIYVDMEIKLVKRAQAAQAQASAPTLSAAALTAQLAPARRLFDRITSLSLSSKKMKFFFKKFLQFEKQEGGNETERIEAVKTKAREYVAAKTAEVDE